MRKLYIILGLLLCWGNAYAQQEHLMVDVPFMNIYSCVDTDVIYTPSEYVSVAVVAYQGLYPGYDDVSIMAYINEQISMQGEEGVRCVKVSGVDLSNPANSKGYIYFRLEPYDGVPGSNNIDLAVWLSGGNTAVIGQMRGKLMFSYGLDSSLSEDGVTFEITGSRPSEQSDYSLRRILPHENVMYFIASVDLNSSFNDGVIPSCSMFLPWESVPTGDYMIYDEYLQIPVSNKIHIVNENVYPDLSWLNKPDERSQERVYNVDTNGEMYFMTAYVPLNADIAALRQVLSDSRYTVGPSGSRMTFRLTGETRRANDIELTFELHCDPNKTTSPKTLITGLSDRMLPGIPNKFVQSRGGQNTAVEVGESDIIVRNTLPGVTYALMYSPDWLTALVPGFENIWNNFTLMQQTGNGGDIVTKLTVIQTDNMHTFVN